MVVIGAAFAVALAVHERTIVAPTRYNPSGAQGGFGYPLAAPRRPSWEAPVAVLIAIGGVAVAVGIVGYRNPRVATDTSKRLTRRLGDS